MPAQQTRYCPRCGADDVHLREYETCPHCGYFYEPDRGLPPTPQLKAMPAVEPSPDIWPDAPATSGSYFALTLPIGGWIAIFVASCGWAYYEWTLSSGDLFSLHGRWIAPYALAIGAFVNVCSELLTASPSRMVSDVTVNQTPSLWPILVSVTTVAAFVVATGLHEHWTAQQIAIGTLVAVILSPLYFLRTIIRYVRSRRPQIK